MTVKLPKAVYRAASMLFGTALILFIIVQSVFLVAFDRQFYQQQYGQLDNAALIGMDSNELMRVTDALIAYLQGEREQLQVEASIHGQTQPIYSEREIAHMIDVLNLMKFAKVVRTASLVVMAACLGVLLTAGRRSIGMLAWGMILSTLTLVAVLALIGIAMAIDFRAAFTVFHQIFFSNDLWQLYSTDILLKIVPEAFFSVAALQVGKWILGLIALPLIGSAIVLWLHRRRKTPLFSGF